MYLGGCVKNGFTVIENGFKEKKIKVFPQHRFIIVTLFYINKPKTPGHKIRRMPKAMRNVLTLLSPKPLNQPNCFLHDFFFFDCTVNWEFKYLTIQLVI